MKHTPTPQPSSKIKNTSNQGTLLLNALTRLFKVCFNPLIKNPTQAPDFLLLRMKKNVISKTYSLWL